LAKHAGAYKSDKRRKEISRQKKQEEKRQRRLSKKVDQKDDTEMIDSDGEITEDQG
jgi:hypothetical protein